MGGKPYLSQEDKKARKSATALKYYHKTKNNPGQKEKNKEVHRKASINYYYKHKDKCVQHVLNWRLKHPGAFKRTQKKAYQKKKYGREVFFIRESLIQKPQAILAVVEEGGVDG